MDLLTELRIIALTFECIWNQEDFQKLVIDSQMLADVSLADAWQGIEAAIPHTGRKLTSTPQTANPLDRKSTRLNSSHQIISYAVFCLKKKKNK